MLKSCRYDFVLESLSNDDLVVDMDIDFGRQLFYMWKSSMKVFIALPTLLCVILFDYKDFIMGSNDITS